MRMEIRSEGPHHGQPVVVAGAPLATARAVGVLLHGRGATALSILDLGDAINRPDVTWLAPQARGNTWYPNRFIAPLESNEPWLSSALAAVGDVVAQVEAAGAAAHTNRPDRLLAGRVPGARRAGPRARPCRRSCRAQRRAYRPAGHGVARRRPPRRHARVPGMQRRRLPHPEGARPRVSRRAPRARGRRHRDLYPGMDHTVNDDEIAHVRGVVDLVMKR